uniref:NADH-ubiquinone oxidoreductase chain 2 n=1 Tax=Pontoscolex corethrurus TaxID=195581 RepID=A0A1W5LJU4_9ANNE|nr:NADH dehydrogenase subunit 2 [Pontoscolex corethrurus]ANJ60064.1 NADH dehydrogenase subunit 2 [Pontoscolex corethrurus]
MSLFPNPPIFLFSATLTSSSIMAISSSNWVFLWISMELNLLSFTPIMMVGKNNQEIEGSIKYFLAQATGSAILLFSSSMLWMLQTWSPNSFALFLTFSILLKMGGAPCHFWYPSVMSSISWIPCLILSTWQKVAPISILAFLLPTNSNIITTLAGLNALTGGIMGMNQNSMRSIMAFSSIGQMGWMMSLMAIYKPVASVLYFIIYMSLIAPLFLIFNTLNTKTIKSLNKSYSKSTLIQASISLLLLSIAGLPPLTGFFPKLMTIFLLTEHSKLLTLMLISGSLMNLFFYLNMMINASMSASEIKSPKSQITSTTMYILILSCTMSTLMLPLTMF